MTEGDRPQSVGVTDSPVATEEPQYPLHVRKIPRTWWLQTRAFRRFFARELTALFVGTFSVILLLFLLALSRGPEHYESFLRWLDIDGLIPLFAVIFLAAVYHTITWFQLTAYVQVVRVGRRLVPRELVTAGLFAAWLAVSGLIVYLHIWFA